VVHEFVTQTVNLRCMNGIQRARKLTVGVTKAKLGRDTQAGNEPGRLMRMTSRHLLVLKDLLAGFLVLAILLYTIQPRISRAQTPQAEADKPVPANSERRSTPELKLAIASEISSLKAANLTKADLKKIEQGTQTTKSESGFTKKQKIFLALWIVVMTGLVIVLIKHPCRAKDPKDCEPIDNGYSY
jgi:hypothetical protein